MKQKGLIGLLLATAIAVVVAAMVSFSGSSGGNDRHVNTLVLPQIGKQLGAVARVTLVHGGAKTTLSRHGDKWVVEDKGDYPANATRLHETLIGLAELRYVERKTRKPDLYSRLAVEDPDKPGAKATLVTVSDDKGSLIGEIIAGKRRVDELGGGTDGIYLRKPGNAQSWLASGTLDLPEDAADWLDRNIVDVPSTAVKEVKLRAADGSTLDIARDKPAAQLALKNAPAHATPKSDDALVEPTTALASLTLTDVQPAAAIHFPEKGVSEAEFTTFDGLTIKVAVVDEGGKSWARFSASGTGAAEKRAQSLDAKLQPWVYAIPDYKAKSLRTTLADVTEKQKAS